MNNAYIMTIETRIDHLIQQVLVDDTGVVDALAVDAVSDIILAVNSFTGNSYDRQYSAGEVVIE